VAGPAFREIMAGGLKKLGVKPTYVNVEPSESVAKKR